MKYGCGRLAVKRINPYILFAYTIELSAMPCRPKKNKILAPRFSLFNQGIMPESDPVQDINSAIYKNDNMISVRKQIYWDAARAFCISLLDLSATNTKSRLVATIFKGDMNKLLNSLRVELDDENW